MSSTVNSIPAANSASGNAVNAPAQNQGNRPSLRPSTNSKASDGGRRQSGSPVDGGQRRSNSQKAWSQGTNPITQRASYSQQNGNMKQSSSPKPASKESNTPDNHAHDRLVFLLTSFIGLTAIITTKNGESFTGIFSSSSLEPSDSSFLLKMVQRASKQDPQRTNGVSDVASPFLGSAPEHSMAFDVKDIVDIAVANVSTADVTAKTANGAASGFRTDVDISGNLAIRERTLKRWEPAAEDEVDMSLESTDSSTAMGWDQFETNTRLFGAVSSYDENLYTTRIDRSDPTYKRKEAEAARIAQEIEGTDVVNSHMREERGLAPIDAGGHDEEDKYSGVRRDEKDFPPLVSGQPNKYTPPARRQPAAQPAPAPASTLKQPATADPASAPVPSTETPPTQASQEKESTPAAKSAADAEQKPAAGKAAPSIASAPKPTAENATSNVEAKLLGHFREFANSEKMKVQERRRNQASYDRTLKLNELMKFSKNFKLATPVPKDLVPILAKDRNKQEKIIQRAQQQTDEKVDSKATPVTAEQKPAPHAPGQSGTMPPPAQSDRPTQPRGRPMYPPTGPHAGPGGRLPHQTMHPGRPGTGMLSHRLADNLQQRKGAAMGPVPSPLPIHDGRIPPTGPAGDQSGVTSPSKTQTPSSAASTKFNVRAMEFKPNPAASTFTPGGASGASSSPQPFFRGRSISRATSPSAFFGAKKPRPIAERPSLNDQFNPIKRMKKESAEQSEKDYTFNGGIPPAYKTLPTWDAPAGNEEKTYLQMFKQPPTVPSISPQNRSASNPQAPHQPQLPFQFQQSNPGMPPVSGPPHGPHHLHPQQHHGSGPPHFDDHRMQMSASTSQIFPSPRLQHSHVGYPSPMAPHAQLAFGQPVPQFYVNQGGPQPAHMRHYPGAPQFVNPQATMGAPMMVQQASSGPYMGVPPYTPQMQMYSPNPGHAYPQHAPPPQPHSGFPSPSRGAPMMMHQNSQPGQPPQPVMFMSPGQHGQPVYAGQQPGHMPPVRGNYPQQQPHFSSSPHQVHQYPPHQHRTPSSGFNQIPQIPPQMPSQPPPAAASGSHPPEAADEAK
ncbi:hypothetical protein ASPWEDRAFT_36403 [Aspergillus wentii DTO 134E9]|uniref:LsmAD domain-containing protein n=1 Tax=Aspergillus wentii DTO 134E9 TaxID=1073089 RepID=A0A1L9RUY3_ASPWE|nr:uncharacterized protein ASPWEDRAFT_36403 [Aspergillus wentii DTO 134E9]KAI9928641.1 hypothetical protein MW887_001856 [Aspergillus wentii]OJJ38725.1 hypothetical protein ASPWEDRAFT_36403 [Aspergillus wentii DTO 134E9]